MCFHNSIEIQNASARILSIVVIGETANKIHDIFQIFCILLNIEFIYFTQ